MPGGSPAADAPSAEGAVNEIEDSSRDQGLYREAKTKVAEHRRLPSNGHGMSSANTFLECQHAEKWAQCLAPKECWDYQ